MARCTVARRMGRMGLQGAVRGRRMKTTCAVVHDERPEDRVNREFQVSRPNALWVSDPRFHHSGAGPDPRFRGGRLYVATWRGFAYTALVIDAYARRIVGWRVSSLLHTDLALDALEQALHERRAPREEPAPVETGDSSITATGACSTSRYATPSASHKRALRPSVGSVGDSPDKGTRGLPRQAVSRGAGSTTMRWPSPSSGCTRPNSSPGAARGVTARQSSSPPSNGYTGTTTGACSDPSAMCLRLHSRHTTPINCMSRRWPPDSSKSPSGKPGAVHRLPTGVWAGEGPRGTARGKRCFVATDDGRSPRLRDRLRRFTRPSCGDASRPSC